MFDLSARLKALVIFIEHRYYGESLPFGKDSYQDKYHLGYLTSEQALADFATLITDIKVDNLEGGEGVSIVCLSFVGINFQDHKSSYCRGWIVWW